MTVVDHEPSGWFLVADGVRLLLDVNCSHGAVSYPFLMELDESERAACSTGGHAYLSALAEEINQSAPGVTGSTSPYRERNLQGAERSMVDAVSIAWLRERGRAARA